ncbi:MAG TPA: hypothetical protein VN238_20270 [Solirubrobacteraceae bacterium]|nr:hypothetical protein [Solirubrobacteraceae bacterium]
MTAAAPPASEPAAAPLSRWRASPGRLLTLFVGLYVFGAGEALLVASDLGNSPWTVFAEGLSRQTPLTVGSATIVISVFVLLLWVPLRQRPGLGTISNAVVVGLAIDATLHLLPDADATPLAVRWIEVFGGIAVVAVGSAIYLRTALGAGPRDGLMTGLHRRTGRPVALVRALIEISALIAGALLGGTFGVGTVAFALLIGPAVARALRLAGVARAGDL